jgi:hypothetical protein
MDVSDFWSAINSIYSSVTPALLITIGSLLAIRISCRDLCFTTKLRQAVAFLSHSKSVEEFATAADRLRIGALVPVALVGAVLVYLVVLGDFAEWFSTAMPGRASARFTPIDILWEQRSEHDLAIVVSHMTRDPLSSATLGAPGAGPSNTLEPSDLMVRFERHYARQLNRLRSKFHERYQAAVAADQRSQALYGGFMLITVLTALQLLLAPLRRNWLWFSAISWRRSLLALVLVIGCTARYRLKWEWNIERQISSELMFVAATLTEESESAPIVPSSETVAAVIESRRQFNAHNWWLARWFDWFTMALWSSSSRQLGQNDEYHRPPNSALQLTIALPRCARAGACS